MPKGGWLKDLASKRLRKMESCVCRAFAGLAFCALLDKDNPQRLPASLEELEELLREVGIRKEAWINYEKMLPRILEELNFLLVEEAAGED